ncbi:MAG: nuclear transport factor 2 family protein [Actinomycetota bacterium]
MSSTVHDDRVAIVDLTTAYCWAIDERNWPALHNIFVPHATAELGNGTESGVDAIVARISAVLNPLDSSQHLITNHQVLVEGDRATSRCYLHAQHVRRAADGGRNYIVAGRYEDELARTPAGWRITHRRLVVMWTDGNSRVVRGG